MALDADCEQVDTGVITATAQVALASDSAFVETTALAPGVGDLEGTIYDANTGLGIPLAYIYLELPLDDNQYHEVWTDDDGNYTLAGVNACPWNGQVEAVGYYGNSGLNVVVSAGMTETFTHTLNASWPSLSHGEVYAIVPPTSTRTVSLTLSNNGSGDLNYHVTDVPAGAGYNVAARGVMPTGVDQQVYFDLAAGPGKFIVYMANQADLSAAIGIQDRSARGHYVLDALLEAAKTQAGIISALDAARVAYESRYIVNALVVEGDVALVDALISRPEVAYIGPNTAIEAPAPAEVSETLEGAEAVEWNISKVNADDVWSDFGATGSGIIVSNIDTGVQWDHPALVTQYRGGGGGDHNHNWWDPYGYGPTVPYDFHGHGTHTMGTMVGDDGGANQIGMAPDATWFTCQGFDQNTGYGYNAELLECAEFILAPWDLTGANANPDMRADVVNNSWGGGAGSVVV